MVPQDGKNPHFRAKPDIAIIQGDPVRLSNDEQTIANPLVVFEVLKPQTRDTVIEVKLPEYKKLQGLRAIIYMEHDKPEITTWVRSSNDSEGEWKETKYTSGKIEIESTSISFLVETSYGT